MTWPVNVRGKARRTNTDADAAAWAAAVTANSGTYTTGQVSALSTFFTTLRAASMWPTNFSVFGPQAGNELAAALVQYKDGTWGPATNSNFVAGDYTPTGGLTGNGTNKKLDTGKSILALTKSNFGMGTWTKTNTAESVYRIDIGSSYAATGATDRFYNATRASTGNAEFGMGSLSTGVAGTTGLISQETSGTTNQQIWANGVSVSNLATWNNDGFQAGTVTVFAGGTTFSTHTLNGYYVGNNMNQATLTAAWAALNTALGR